VTGVGTSRLGLAAGITLGALAMAAGVALTGTSGWLITRASEHPPLLTLAVAVVGVRFFGIARPVLRYLERLVSHHAAFSVLAATRVHIYDALIPLTPARLGGRRQQEVLAGVVQDADAELDRLLRVIAPTVVALLVAAAAVGMQTALLPAAGAILAVSMLVTTAVIPALSAAAAGRAEHRFAAERAEVSAGVLDILGGASELIAAGAADRAQGTLAVREQTLAHTSHRSAWATGLGSGLLTTATGWSVAATALVAVPALTSGRISGPTMAVLLLIPLALTEVLTPLPEAATLAIRVAAARARLKTLLSIEPAITTTAKPAPFPSGPYHLQLTGIRARWSPDGPDALPTVDLDLPPGRRVAIIGPSGCGKSTLVAVLLRFLDPSAGHYRINGVDVGAADPDELRTVVGLVDDAPYLFSTTLAENVRLARPEADDHAVEAALRQARLGPWLDGLTQGLSTRLGDGAAAVSGGERARIALARVFLADQPVLVLDEPTAHLDAATAHALIADILDTTQGRTVVLITHRHEGLDLVDEVVSLAGGGGNGGSAECGEQCGERGLLARHVRTR
jgi:ATP-binding cassette subfamily C protein CydCD